MRVQENHNYIPLIINKIYIDIQYSTYSTKHKYKKPTTYNPWDPQRNKIKQQTNWPSKQASERARSPAERIAVKRNSTSMGKAAILSYIFAVEVFRAAMFDEHIKAQKIKCACHYHKATHILSESLVGWYIYLGLLKNRRPSATL